MTALLRRVRKLEDVEQGGSRGYRRLLSCTVRKGHEAEDQAQALAEIGASVEEGDFVILRVSVTPEGRSHAPGFRPSAEVLPGFRPLGSGLKTIRRNQDHG